MFAKKKNKEGTFFEPSKNPADFKFQKNPAEQILASSNMQDVYISFENYGTEPNDAIPQVVRWNRFKKALDNAFPTLSLGHSMLDGMKIVVPGLLYVYLKNLRYSDMYVGTLEEKLAEPNLDKTLSLIQTLRSLRKEKNLFLLENIKTLIEQGADPTVADGLGWNTLHIAAYFNAEDLVEWVWNSSCINENEKRILLAQDICDIGVTPAILAKRRGHHAVCEKLCEMKNELQKAFCPLDLVEILRRLRKERNLSPQEKSALLKNIKTLIEQGVDPTLTDGCGWNILHVAAHLNSKKLVALVEGSPYINENKKKVLLTAIAHHSSLTPAILAEKRGHHDVYEKLCEMDKKLEEAHSSCSFRR